MKVDMIKASEVKLCDMVAVSEDQFDEVDNIHRAGSFLFFSTLRGFLKVCTPDKVILVGRRE